MDFIALCNHNFFIKTTLLLVETITGIRRNQFSKKNLFLVSVQHIFRLVEAIFLLHCSETPAGDSISPPSGNVFSMKSFISVSGNQFYSYKWFPQAEKSCKLYKRIMFPLNKNSDSTSQNESSQHFNVGSTLLQRCESALK